MNPGLLILGVAFAATLIAAGLKLRDDRHHGHTPLRQWFGIEKS